MSDILLILANYIDILINLYYNLLYKIIRRIRLWQKPLTATLLEAI